MESRLVVQYSLLTLVAFGLVVSQLLLKAGVRGQELSVSGLSDLFALLRQVLTSPTLLAGYGLAAVVAIIWLVVISRMDLSFAVPLMSSIYYILLLLTSLWILHEAVTLWRWVGTGLILLGMIVLSLSNR